jgi:PTS system lactose-specific IIA component
MEESPFILKAFEIIASAGSAKSLLMEALAAAKAGNITEAERLCEEADKMLLDAHHMQTALLQEEAAGTTHELGLIIVHSQDHLMTTMLLKDMMGYIIELYRRTTT